MLLKTPFHFLFSQLFEDTERERDNIVWKVKEGTTVLPIVRHVSQAEAVWTMFPNKFVGMAIARVDHTVTLDGDFYCHDNHLHSVRLDRISDAEIDRVNKWVKTFFEHDPNRLVNSAWDLRFIDHGTEKTWDNQWYKELHAAGFIPKVYDWSVGPELITKVMGEDVYAYELYNAPLDEDGRPILGFLIRAENLVADYVEFDDDDEDSDSVSTD